MSRAIPAALLLWAALACGGAPEAITSCEPERGIYPVCGLQNPEDLVVLADGTILISQMGTMDGDQPGGLAHFDPDSGQLRALFPRDGIGSPPQSASRAPAPGWGAADCPGAPGADFSPHGIDLSERPGGRLQLLVVNHGGRESVEFFEIESGAEGVRAEWRGCALPGDPHFMNDVAALPDGGFVVTHMFAGGSGVVGLFHSVRGVLGFDTGYVLEWSAGDGFRELPGSAGPMPNGVAASPDGRYVFVNLYLGDEVRRIARDGSEPAASAAVAHPDNLSWAPDGSLLVASHTAPFSAILGCGGIEEGSCPIAFAIVALDPVSMQTRVVFENQGAPMGAGTVAVERSGELFIGSFSGDRIIRTRPSAG